MTKFLKVEDLQEDETYLALRYFNSKRIIFQPCKVISTIPTKNKNGYLVILVRFLDGTVSETVYVNKDFELRSNTTCTLKPIGNWFKKEMKNLQEQINELSRQYDLIKAEYDKIC